MDMNRKTKRNIAVVAGLTAVLALSSVAGALTTAHADETAPETVSAQSVEGVDPQSFSSRDWGWYKGDWHFGNWPIFHPKVDFNHNGFCDLCWSWIGDHDCGGDEDPKPETYTVRFYDDENLVGGVTKGSDTFKVSAYINDLPTLGNLEKDGYTLIWVDKETGVVVPADTVVVEDMDLLATWEKIEEPVTVYHTVTFVDPSGASADQSFQVEDGKTVDESSVKEPTREGYTFVSWYTSTEYTTEFDFDTPIKGDMTVYAKWVEDEESTDPTDPTDPGTDPEEPGTDTENPGDGSGDQGGNTDQGDTTNPGDNTTDQGNDTTKPAGDATSTDDGSNDDADAADEDTIPNTGDATVAVSGIAALGTAVAGLGVFLRRRS